ncbi:type I-B CRISPR-associated protein Cas5 [Nanoarchaeota archaeon]|nr:MAG: type I-B CRISPR-associated protein Cas5 [Nanoarchaeota archaeon]
MKIRMTVFDVAGYFAHFRKYFSTTSSLSYVFPPRTAIAGMIAGILGYDRDSYYDLFSSDVCKIALKIMNPARRITHTLNYLMTDKPLTIKKLRGMSSPAQIHVEILVPDGGPASRICYRLFFAHEDESLQEELAMRIRCKKFCYPPSLGTANFIADLNYVDTVDADLFKPDREIDIQTIVPASVVKQIFPMEDRRIFLEELVPADFTADRLLRRKETYIYEGTGKTIRLLVDCEAFRCHLGDGEVVGVFM